MATAKTKTQIKKELIKEAEKAIGDKKSLRWLSDQQFHQLRPKAILYREGIPFRLRYVESFDSIFEEDQPKDVEVKLKGISNIDPNVLITSPNQVALNMFLWLNPNNKANGGERYWLEDRVANAKAELEKYTASDNAVRLINESELDTLKAVYYAVRNFDPDELSIDEIKLEIRKAAMDNPDAVIKAFDNKINIIRYQYLKAKKLGYIVETDTSCRFREAPGVILECAFGEDVGRKFAELCMTEEGELTYQTLKEKLIKG